MTSPALLKHTAELAKVTRQLSAADLARLMKLSDALAQLNYERFQSFKASARGAGASAAAYAFDGDTYMGLRAREFDAQQMEFAQKHLGILSGLYGFLRPLDAIEPYRLEMGTRLQNARGTSLYAFWGTRIAEHINKLMQAQHSSALINLASQEYFGAVDLDALRSRVITATFKEERQGQLKVISFNAKRARGAMARYIVEHRLTEPEALKEFNVDGYRFSKLHSSMNRPSKSTSNKPNRNADEEWVFTRTAQA